jgi:hypothetical protein
VSASGVGPVTAADPVALAHRILEGLPTGGRPLFALDHDGTLSPIAPTPEAAVLAPGVRAVLVRLAAHAEVAVVSGRALADLEARLGDLPVTLVAEHGLRVRTPDGSEHTLADAPSATELAWLRTRLGELLGSAGPLVSFTPTGRFVLTPGPVVESDLGFGTSRVRGWVRLTELRPLLDALRSMGEPPRLTDVALAGNTVVLTFDGSTGEFIVAMQQAEVVDAV